MGYIKGEIEKEQYSFLPMCFDNLIEENNPVRMINSFVDSLDIEKLGFKNAISKVKGRPGYNPKMMLKLYLYGYFNGIRSSRKLAKESKRNIELFWLLENLKPDFRTISDFRKDNINCMKGVFVEFSNLCEKLNLIGKEIVAIDGSKFRASNSRRKNYTKGKLEKQIEYYEDNVDRYMYLLDKMDEQGEDSAELNISKEELNKKIEESRNRIEESRNRIEELSKMKDTVEKEGEISLTDIDSKHMKVSNNGTDICHNVQIAVDNKNDIVVAIDVTSSPADQTQLYNMSKKAKEELKTQELTVLADKGYWNGEELKKCKEDNITTIVSSPKEQGNIGYKKSDFRYDKDKDVYICPNGAELHRTGGQRIRYINYKACKNCPIREKCTNNKRGKTISVTKNEEILRENVKRQIENMELYKTRQMIVEHVFGTVKRALGYTHLLLRGNEKVKGESFMHFLIYNMKRVLNIAKIDDVIALINR